MLVPLFFLQLYKHYLSKENLPSEVLPSGDLPSEFFSKQVHLFQAMCTKDDRPCQIRMCTENLSWCSEFGDFESSEDYGNIELVRKRVCDYKLYRIAEIYLFTSQQYERYVTHEQQLSFLLYDFMVVSLQMFRMSSNSAIRLNEKSPQSMRKFWCG